MLVELTIIFELVENVSSGQAITYRVVRVYGLAQSEPNQDGDQYADDTQSSGCLQGNHDGLEVVVLQGRTLTNIP